MQVLRSILPKGGKILLVLRKDALVEAPSTHSDFGADDGARRMVDELFSEWCDIRDLSGFCPGNPPCSDEYWFVCTKRGHY